MQYCNILIAARHCTPVIRQWDTFSGPRTMIFVEIRQSFRWELERSTVERILNRCFSAGESTRCCLRRLFESMMGTRPLDRLGRVSPAEPQLQQPLEDQGDEAYCFLKATGMGMKKPLWGG